MVLGAWSLHYAAVAGQPFLVIALLLYAIALVVAALAWVSTPERHFRWNALLTITLVAVSAAQLGLTLTRK